MAARDVKILDKLYINQNTICLVLSYLGIYFSDNRCLDTMCWLLLIFSLASVIYSVCLYSIEYGYKKWYKAKGYELDYTKKKTGKCIAKYNGNTSTSCSICPFNDKDK